MNGLVYILPNLHSTMFLQWVFHQCSFVSIAMWLHPDTWGFHANLSLRNDASELIDHRWHFSQFPQATSSHVAVFSWVTAPQLWHKICPGKKPVLKAARLEKICETFSKLEYVCFCLGGVLWIPEELVPLSPAPTLSTMPDPAKGGMGQMKGNSWNVQLPLKQVWKALSWQM